MEKNEYLYKQFIQIAYMLNLNEEDRCISAFHFIFISFIFFPSFVLRHDWPIHFRFSNEKWPTWVIYSLSHSDNWTEKTLSRQDTQEKSNELLTIPNKLLYLQHSVSCSHMSDNSETQDGREKRHTHTHKIRRPTNVRIVREWKRVHETSAD